MKGKRLLYTLRLYTIRNSRDRAEYLRKKGVFCSIGQNCTIMDRSVPLYAGLIKLGNNVHLASNVHFVTHDVVHKMLNGIIASKDGFSQKNKVQEKAGCIEIGDNVFVGAGSRILYNVKIGSNCIIGAGSLVTGDIPDNSVAAGVPARVIGGFEPFFQKRLSEPHYPFDYEVKNEEIQKELADYLWEQFYSGRRSEPK